MKPFDTVALAGPDEPAAAGVAQDAVGQRHVLGVVLHVEEAVVALRLPARRLQGDVVDPDVADAALHADGVAAVGRGRARLLDVPDGHVLDDDVAGLADVDAQLVEDGPAADPDDRDVADLLELDHAGGGVAARARHLGGVAVVDGPLDLDGDRGAAAGPAAQGRVDRGPRGGPHRLPARAAGGPAVLGRVAGGAAGRRRRLGASAGPRRPRPRAAIVASAAWSRSATGRLILVSPSSSNAGCVLPRAVTVGKRFPGVNAS